MPFDLGLTFVVNRTDVVTEERTGEPNYGGQFHIAVFSGQPVQIGICDAGGSQIAFNHADDLVGVVAFNVHDIPYGVAERFPKITAVGAVSLEAASFITKKDK